MNRIILFTPIGGTDPISENNWHDGAFLHICRHYQPTDVYLYMSKEILEKQQRDARYTYCLEKLCELQGREICRYEIIERPDLTNVQDFNFFFEEFRGILREIYQKMDDTDRLLVNISSGTPAMKSGLLVLMTMGDYPGTAIQVTTPVRHMNEHTHREEDIEALWECNLDNEEGSLRRTEEVTCPNLSLLKYEEIVKELIRRYDYHAAVDATYTMPPQTTRPYTKLLELAYAREMLDNGSLDRLSSECGVNVIPITDGGKRKYFEYALSLDLKRRRGEYADFIRAISPLTAALFEMILEKQFGIRVDDYCRTNQWGIRVWSEEKLAGTPVIEVFEKEFSDFKFGPVYSAALKVLIQAQPGVSPDLGKLAEDIRKVEEKIRNQAAHTVTGITDADVQRFTGFTSSQIMDLIRKAFRYGGINAKREDWDSYDLMNDLILSRIGI